MDLYARALRYRWKWIAVVVVVAIGVSGTLALRRTAQYQAEAQMFVGTTARNTDSIGLNQGGQFAQERVKTYVGLMTSTRVLKPVIEHLGLHLSVAELGRRVVATSPSGTVLLNVRVSDGNPRLAETLANAIAKEFAVLVPEIETAGTDKDSPVAVSVVRDASLPQSPTGLPLATLLMLGLLIGLMLGLGLAVTWEAFAEPKPSDQVRQEKP